VPVFKVTTVSTCKWLVRCLIWESDKLWTTGWTVGKAADLLRHAGVGKIQRDRKTMLIVIREKRKRGEGSTTTLSFI